MLSIDRFGSEFYLEFDCKLFSFVLSRLTWWTFWIRIPQDGHGIHFSRNTDLFHAVIEKYKIIGGWKVKLVEPIYGKDGVLSGYKRTSANHRGSDSLQTC